VFDLILGTTLEIDTPEGKTLNLTVPSGSQSGTSFSITGHGIPNTRNNRRGKLLIKITAAMPKVEQPELVNKIREIQSEINNRT